MVLPDRADRIVSAISDSPLYGRELRAFAMDLLSKLDGYEWVGVYRLEGETLVLDEYVGSPTDHTRITIGHGVCGTAVAQRKNQIVEDVREIDNYLSCSTDTRSEIVVLIWRHGAIVGQIDVDGHQVGNFDHTDEELLQAVGEVLSQKWHYEAAVMNEEG